MTTPGFAPASAMGAVLALSLRRDGMVNLDVVPTSLVGTMALPLDGLQGATEAE